MTAELWLHRPCEHGHEGSFRTHPPVAEMLRGDELPCEGGSRVRLDPDTVVFTIPNDMWGTDDEYTVQDVIDALLEEESRAALPTLLDLVLEFMLRDIASILEGEK